MDRGPSGTCMESISGPWVKNIWNMDGEYLVTMDGKHYASPPEFGRKVKVCVWGPKTGLTNFSLNKDRSPGYEYSYYGLKNINSCLRNTKTCQKIPLEKFPTFFEFVFC